jgi:hypothetical protein
MTDKFKFYHKDRPTLIYNATREADGKLFLEWVRPDDDAEQNIHWDGAQADINFENGMWIKIGESTEPPISDRIKAFTTGTDFAVMQVRERWEVIAFMKVFIAESDEELLEVFRLINQLKGYTR